MCNQMPRDSHMWQYHIEMLTSKLRSLGGDVSKDVYKNDLPIDLTFRFCGYSCLVLLLSTQKAMSP